MKRFIIIIMVILSITTHILSAKTINSKDTNTLIISFIDNSSSIYILGTIDEYLENRKFEKISANTYVIYPKKDRVEAIYTILKNNPKVRYLHENQIKYTR